MEKRVSLVDLFNLIEADLVLELRSISLPEDMGKLESILNDIFSHRIDIARYYGEITPVALGALQHCFRIIAIQNKLLSSIEIEPSRYKVSCNLENVKQNSGNSITTRLKDNKEVIATFVGGVIGGGWLLPSWGSIIAATIGCAIAKCYNDTQKVQVLQPTQAKLCNVSLNIKMLIDTIGEMCQQIDDLMKYIQNSIDVYRNNEVQSREINIYNEFPQLIDSIKNLFLSHSREESLDKMHENIVDVFATLENYGYKIVKYSEEFSYCFSIVQSPHVSKAQMSKPAILKGDEIVEKGRYLVPLNDTNL